VGADRDDWSLSGGVDSTLDHSCGFLSIDYKQQRNESVKFSEGKRGLSLRAHQLPF
jgi:hypothetical protein